MAKKAKKTKKKAAKKKTTAKKTAKKKSKRKAPAAFMAPLKPSAALAKVTGPAAVPRTQVVKKLWAYIKKNNLQNKTNKRNIDCDDHLKEIFGKGTVTMFEMNTLLKKHLSKA